MYRCRRRHCFVPHVTFTAFLIPLVATCIFIGSVNKIAAAENLTLKRGDTTVLTFQDMERVWVTDPEILDVVVSTYNELLVFAKTGRPRQTTRLGCERQLRIRSSRHQSTNCRSGRQKAIPPIGQ